MNLVEAIKTGLRFRRLGDPGWLPNSNVSLAAMEFKGQDIVANHWEVDNKTTTITTTQFWEACSRVMLLVHSGTGHVQMSMFDYESRCPDGLSRLKDLARELKLMDAE